MIDYTRDYPFTWINMQREWVDWRRRLALLEAEESGGSGSQANTDAITALQNSEAAQNILIGLNATQTEVDLLSDRLIAKDPYVSFTRQPDNTIAWVTESGATGFIDAPTTTSQTDDFIVTALTDNPAFEVGNWADNNNRQRFMSDSFKITANSADVTPLEVITVPEGTTETFYMIGRQHVGVANSPNSSTNGMTLEITNTGGVLSAVVLLPVHHEIITGGYLEASYDDLTNDNSLLASNITQDQIDYLLTPASVDDKQDARLDVLEARLEVQQFSGRFLLDPNEFTGWATAGFTDEAVANDLGNVGDGPSRIAGGFIFPFDVQLKTLYTNHYNSNSLVEPWGFRIIAQTKSHESNAVVNTDILREVVGEGPTAVAPRDYQNTVNRISEIDISTSPVIPAGTLIGFGVEAPTANATNYYVNIMAGYLSYERV